MKTNAVEKLLLLWVLIMSFTAGTVIGAAKMRQAETNDTVVEDMYPCIPKCDKGTWDRVTGGCDEQANKETD